MSDAQDHKEKMQEVQAKHHKKVSEAVVTSGAYNENGTIFTNVPWRSGNANLTGGVNGWRGYRDWKRQQSSLLQMSFHVAPTSDGAVATIGGRF